MNKKDLSFFHQRLESWNCCNEEKIKSFLSIVMFFAFSLSCSRSPGHPYYHKPSWEREREREKLRERERKRREYVWVSAQAANVFGHMCEHVCARLSENVCACVSECLCVCLSAKVLCVWMSSCMCVFVWNGEKLFAFIEKMCYLYKALIY